MKLSQLIHAMDRYDTINVMDAKSSVPLNKKCIYSGEVKGIFKDNPINKCHVKFVAAVHDELVVEVVLPESEDTE